MRVNYMSDLKFDPTKALVTLKSVTTYEKTAFITLGEKYDTLYWTAGVRDTDFVASTTRFDKTEWTAIKLLVRQSFVDPEMRRVALLSKEAYKAELKTLNTKEEKAMQNMRNACSTKVGSKMRDFAEAMLVRDPAAVAAKAKAKAKAKGEAKAAKAAKAEAKTMKDKIVIQLTNTVAIMQGDDAPDGFDFVALQEVLVEALNIMGVKLS